MFVGDRMVRSVTTMLVGILLMIAFSGCATQKIAGNEVGGVVPLAGISREEASELARGHCAKYGRTSRLLGVRTDDGQKVVFECV